MTPRSARDVKGSSMIFLGQMPWCPAASLGRGERHAGVVQTSPTDEVAHPHINRGAHPDLCAKSRAATVQSVRCDPQGPAVRHSGTGARSLHHAVERACVVRAISILCYYDHREAG